MCGNTDVDQRTDERQPAEMNIVLLHTANADISAFLKLEEKSY